MIILSDIKKDTINEDITKEGNFDNKGKFLPGNTIGKLPRKKAYNVEELKQVIENVEKAENKNLLEHYLRMALKDKRVLMHLMDKFVPNVSITELKNSSGVPFNVIIQQFLGDKKEEKVITIEESRENVP